MGERKRILVRVTTTTWRNWHKLFEERLVRNPHDDPIVPIPQLREERFCIGAAIIGLAIIIGTASYAFLFMR